jgi:hypothetical protein
MHVRPFRRMDSSCTTVVALLLASDLLRACAREHTVLVLVSILFISLHRLLVRVALLESEHASSFDRVTRFDFLDRCSYVNEGLCFGILFARSLSDEAGMGKQIGM